MTTRVTVEPAVARWPVWTTTARLVGHRSRRAAGARAAVIEDHLARVDAAASRFQPGSEVRRLAPAARLAGGPVSPLLAELLRTALAGGRDHRRRGRPDRRRSAARPLGRVPAPRAVPAAARRTPTGSDVQLDGTAADRPGRVRCWTSARPRRRTPPTTAPPRWPRGSAAACWSASAATCGPPGRRRTAAGRCWSRTAPDEPASAGPPPAPARSPPPPRCAGPGAAGGRALHHIVDPPPAVPAAPVWRTAPWPPSTCVAANTLSTAAAGARRRRPALLASPGCAPGWWRPTARCTASAGGRHDRRPLVLRPRHRGHRAGAVQPRRGARHRRPHRAPAAGPAAVRRRRRAPHGEPHRAGVPGAARRHPAVRPVRAAAAGRHWSCRSSAHYRPLWQGLGTLAPRPGGWC